MIKNFCSYFDYSKVFLKPMIFSVLYCLFAGSPCCFAEMRFSHPGATHNQADLLFVKSRIKAGEQPWAGYFEQLRKLAVPGDKTRIPMDENGQKDEGRKAYANALAWWYTEEVGYAENAINILNHWGKSFNGYEPLVGQNQLVGGWIGSLLGPAAELMRGYQGWKPADQAMVQAMFKKHFYPVLNTMSNWNGNVDLTQIDAMMNIAVFCEDEKEFRLGMSRFNSRTKSYFYLESDAKLPDMEFWFRPKKWVNGLTQETCRDNGHHAQFAIASAIHTMEVAWNQGVDLYGEHSERYTAALELLALQLHSGEMQGTCSNNKSNGNLFATWEVGYNHYHNRKGRKLPNTKLLLETRVRSNGKSEWNIFYESLTHNILYDFKR